jgi:putative transposase
MPRANRYILPGQIYHLTHHCHDRRCLFRFAKDRNGYRSRLREAVAVARVSLLACNITSNHVHLLVYVEASDSVAQLMQQAAQEWSVGGVTGR